MRPGNESISSLGERAFGSLQELLLLHCSRWREIAIHSFTIDVDESQIFSQIEGNLPLLESADLMVKSHEMLNHFAIAPYLRRLRLEIMPSYELPPVLFQPALATFPWTQLVHLDIATGLSAALHHILVLATKISFLKVRLNKSVYTRAETITSSTISTLHLYGNYCENEFLDWLTLPAVRDLRVSNQTTRVKSFLSRSACSLSSLEIAMPETSHFIELMQLCPNLPELSVTFEGVHDWDAMVSSLTEKFEDDLPLAPNLRSLTLRWPGPFCTKKGISLHRFVNMLESRWTPRGAALDAALMRSPLSHVEVNGCISREIFVSGAPIALLRRILEEGLDVKFLTAETNDGTICKRNLLSSPPYTI